MVWWFGACFLRFLFPCAVGALSRTVHECWVGVVVHVLLGALLLVAGLRSAGLWGSAGVPLLDVELVGVFVSGAPWRSVPCRRVTVGHLGVSEKCWPVLECLSKMFGNLSVRHL